MKRALVAAGLVVALGGVSYGIAAATDTSSASCNSTPNSDGTVTCNITAQVDVTPATQTVPGPTTTVPGPTTIVTTTQTVTQTVTVTPTPTTTPPPPPPSFFAAGEARNATNTGLAGDGINPASLTPTGSTTYDSTFSGTAGSPDVISLKAYTGEIDVTGDYITIKDCSLSNGGLNSIGFLLEGHYDTVQNCTITSPAGQSMYEPIWIFGDHNSVVNDDVSRGDNIITTYGTNVSITGSYLHDSETASDPSDHPDAIEIYGGGPTVIDSNRIHETNLYDSPINEAPWGSYKVSGLTVSNNFIDNGQAMALIDNQNTSCGNGTQPTGNCLINTRIVHNAMGGHTCPASNPQCFDYYKALENYENRPIAQDDATEAANPNDIEWPTSGPNANQWEETQVTTYGDPALTPNRDGQVVLPSCPSPC